MSEKEGGGITKAWRVAMQIPPETRTLIMAHGYDELSEEQREYVDCMIADFHDAMLKRGAGARFSKPMARELFYFAVQYIMVGVMVGEDWDYTK